MKDVDVGGQWTVPNKDRDRLTGGLDPTGEAIGVVDQRYPKHRRMSTQRDRAGRQLPEGNRLISRYLVRDFTMGDIGIYIPPPRRSPSRRIPELVETEQQRLVRWRSTSLRVAGHPFMAPTRGAHMDPRIGYKCCTNSRTLVQEYLSTKGHCWIGFPTVQNQEPWSGSSHASPGNASTPSPTSPCLDEEASGWSP